MRKILLLLVTIVFSTGVLAQKIIEVKKKDLPKPIEKYIYKNMPGASVFKAVKLDDKGTLTYSVAVDVRGNKKILVFDKTGKFLKKGDDLPKSVNKAGVNNTTQKPDPSQQNPPAEQPKTADQNNPKK